MGRVLGEDEGKGLGEDLGELPDIEEAEKLARKAV
jgi:hypothetical protein